MSVPALSVEDSSGPDVNFTELHQRCRPRLERYLRRCYINAPSLDIEEVVQETFARAHQDYGKLDPHRDPWPWLVVVARHVICDHYRWESRWARSPEELLLDLPDTRPTPDAVALSTDDRRLLGLALSALPVRQRTVLIMRVLEGRSFADISARTGYSENCIRQQLWRAKAGLRREYESRGGARHGLWGLLWPGWSLTRQSARQTSLSVAAPLCAATMAVMGVGAYAWTTSAPQSTNPMATHTLVPAVALSSDSLIAQGSSTKPKGLQPLPRPSSMADKPVSSAASPVMATIAIAEAPLAEGESHRFRLVADTPLGTVGVEVAGDNGEGWSPVCSTTPRVCG